MITRVLASVIEHDGRFLVCRRPRHERHGGLWEFPGGKVKGGSRTWRREDELLSLPLAPSDRRYVEVRLGLSGSSLRIPSGTGQEP